MDDAAINAWCRAVDAVAATANALGASAGSQNLHINESLPAALAARCVRVGGFVTCHWSTGRGHATCVTYDIDGNGEYGVILARAASDAEVVTGEHHDPHCPHFVAPARCSSPSERDEGVSR